LCHVKHAVVASDQIILSLRAVLCCKEDCMSEDVQGRFPEAFDREQEVLQGCVQGLWADRRTNQYFSISGQWELEGEIRDALLHIWLLQQQGGASSLFCF